MVEHKIINELNQIYNNASYSKFNLIQSKEGIHVYRFEVNEMPVIVKMFTSNEAKREIINYNLLKTIGVPTIKVLGTTENCICLEDIDNSKDYRLGVPEDLNDITIARMIARWYKCLHKKGAKISDLSNLYRESNTINSDNLEFLNLKVKNEVWQILIDNLNKIQNIVNNLEETLVYNDFYWTNLVVYKNKKDTLMFDYNLLGRGYRYSDIRNVCSSLSDSCKKAFLDEYGEYNRFEKIVDECISPVITLIFAFRRDKFPRWGNESLKIVESGELLKRVNKVIDYT